MVQKSPNTSLATGDGDSGQCDLQQRNVAQVSRLLSLSGAKGNAIHHQLRIEEYRLETRSRSDRRRCQRSDLLVERRGGVIDFTAPSDGPFVIKVHELTFRGGSDFFYRLSLNKLLRRLRYCVCFDAIGKRLFVAASRTR